MTSAIDETASLELAKIECRTADFGDSRLEKRMPLILASSFRRPMASTPVASAKWSATKATYRFMNNKKVTAEKILDPHINESATRAREASGRDILVIGDSTQLDFSGRKKTKDLGYIGANQLGKPLGLGLHLHTSIAVSGEGLPLGVLQNRIWARKNEDFGKRAERQHTLSIYDKESVKWLNSLAAASRFKAAVNDESKRVIAVFDREGDIYSVFGEARDEYKVDILVRAQHDRLLSTTDPTEKLWKKVSKHFLGTMAFRVPRGKTGTKERESELSVFATAVSLLEPPRRPKGEKGYGEIKLNAVIVRETTAPESGDTIEWKLLTNLPIDDLADIDRIITYYRHRWMIERFFRTLKSGCAIEKRQYATADAIEKCLALDSMVAWMILHLTVLGRKSPDLPCTTVFEECEWQAVWVWLHKSRDLPEKPPTLNEMVRMIGRLGGHLARAGDGMPGTDTLWRGMQRVPDLSGMWSLLNHLPPPPESRSALPV